ncbi:MAG: hypothetical protein WDW38_007833 [Sanguina aurantia]
MLTSMKSLKKQQQQQQRMPFSRHLTMVASAKFDAASSSVKLIVQGRKLQVTDAIKAYVEQKVSHAIHKYQNTLMEVDVKLSARGGDTGSPGKREQKVEVTIYTLRNGVLRVEDSEENLYASIDIVCDKARVTDPSNSSIPQRHHNPPATERVSPKLAAVSWLLSPCSQEMETDAIQVVYKRETEGYGVILPTKKD